MSSPTTATPTAVPTKKKGENSRVDDVLTSATTLLDVAQQLAPLIPVPFVTAIFGSAKVILDTVDRVKKNKEQCAELAKHVVEVSHDVNKAVHGKEQFVGEDLKMALEQLKVILAEIETFMKTHASKSFFQHLKNRGTVTSKLEEFTSKLDFSMRTFRTTCSIRLEIKLEEVHREVQAVNRNLVEVQQWAKGERKYDGQYRIYHQADLRLRRVIAHEQLEGDNEEGYVADYFGAEVRGKAVIVKVQQGATKTFDKSLTTLKKVWHPNIAQLEGYSMDDQVKFLVLKGELHPLAEYMTVLPSKDLVKQCSRVMNELSMAEGYLNRRGLKWSGKHDTLMIDRRTNETVVGALDDIDLLQDWRVGQAYPFDHIQNASIKDAEESSIQTANTFVRRAVAHSKKKAVSIDGIASFWARNHPNLTYHSHKWDRRPPCIGSIGYFAQEPPHESSFVFLEQMPGWDAEFDWPTRARKFRCFGTVDNGMLNSSEPLESHTLIRLVRDQAAFIPVAVAYEYLALHGPQLSETHKVKLEDLVVVTGYGDDVWARTEVLKSDLYFHVRPRTNLEEWLPMPWGYFSTNPDAQEDGKPEGMTRWSAEDAERDDYDCTLPGVSAYTSQSLKVEVAKLNAEEADVIRVMHEVVAGCT